MRFLQLILFVLLFSLTGYSQTFEIKIFISDSVSGTKLSNVNIQLSDKYFTSSNPNGEADFRNVLAGYYQLKVTHVGYKSFEKFLELSSDTTIIVSMVPLSIRLGEVIVTSSKFEKNPDLLPYPVSVISEKEIQIDPSQTVSDLLKSESGISLLRDGIWGTEISIRGLTRSNVVTLVDGSRIETSTDISARLSMFDLSDIERVEVIKGAASSLYGSGATGGIINVITKSGSYDSNFNIKGNLSSSFNSVNNLYANGINIFSSGKNWIAKLSGSFRKADNTKTPSGTLTNSQFEDNSISALFRLKLFDDHEVKINFQRFKAFDVGIPGASPLFPTNAIVTYPQEERQLYNFEYKINNLSKSFVKLSAKYFHQFLSRDVENIPGIVQFIPAANGQPPRRVSVLKISPGADHYTNGAQTQLDFSFSNHYLISGIDFWKRDYNGLRTRDQKIDILNPADSSVLRTIYKTIFEKPLPDASYYSAGIFVQDDFKLNDISDITFGGRYDYIWLNNSETLNPLYEINDGTLNNNPAGQKIIWQEEKANNHSYVFNAGLLLKLNNFSSLSFNSAKSFRSPSLEERYQYIDLGSIVRVGNPGLAPEDGYYFDLGVKLFPANLKFNLNLFLNTLTNLVTEVPGIYEGRNALIKTNVGKALLYGLDYSFNFSFSSKADIYNNLSYVRGLDKTNDKDLPQIPPLNLLIGFRYYLSDWLMADISSYIFDKQDKVAAGELVTPGYAYFNIKLHFTDLKIGKVNFNIIAVVENILNKEYRNHLSTNRGLILSEPGRNFFVKTNIAF